MVVNAPAEALDALTEAAPERRRAGALYLGDHPGPAAAAALLAALGDPQAAVQQAIIQALARQAAAELVTPLVQALSDPNPTRRSGARGVLVEFCAQEPELAVRMLTSAAPEARQWAAEALGELEHAAARPALAARLLDPAEHPSVRRAAALALGQLGQVEATPALLTAAHDGDFWLRQTAIEALGRLGDPAAAEPLAELLRTDAWTRPAVLRVLGLLGQSSAVPGLVAALEDANEAVRAASLEALYRVVVEPAGRRPGTQRTARLRPLIPVDSLRRELNRHQRPHSLYAAHLLGWLGRPEGLLDLIEALAGADEALRDAAMEAILRFGPAALPTLFIALARPETHLREHAAHLIGLIGDASAASALADYLRDPQLAVRLAALRALNALGGEVAHTSLVHAIVDPAMRETAFGIVSQTTGETATAELKAFLQRFLYESQGSENLRWAAAQALSLLGDEIAVSILLNAMRLPEPAIRQPAADALARVRGRRAVNVLIEALGDRDWLVRQKAVEALSSIADSRAVAALVPLTRDPEWRVRRVLAGALGRIADSRVYAPLSELAGDPDRWVRRAALEVCGRLAEGRLAEAVRAGLTDPEAEVRLAALQALQPWPQASLAEPVAGRLNDPEPAVRQAAARTLALLVGAPALEALSDLARDPVNSVRGALASVLGELGSDEGLPILEQLLRDPAPGVRQEAGAALAHLGSFAAAEALADALTQPGLQAEAQTRLLAMGDVGLRVLLGAARSSDPELRLAAAQALRQARSPHAVPTLRQMLKDADTRVRRAAEEALQAGA